MRNLPPYSTATSAGGFGAASDRFDSAIRRVERATASSRDLSPGQYRIVSEAPARRESTPPKPVIPPPPAAPVAIASAARPWDTTLDASDAPVSSRGHILGGRFQLASLIATGGMGSVWRARDLRLHVDVAVKILRSDLSGEASEVLAIAEAHAAAAVRHPSVVQVYDVGQTDSGDAYVVMELLDGTTLSNHLEVKGTLPPAVAVQLMLPIVSALIAAHARGIIHRDLKPENVFLAKDHAGRVVPKLIDFGVAKHADPEAGSVAWREGLLVGSAEYMSPEQVLGSGSVDARTDVWAVCIVLYELISGTTPFSDESLFWALAAIVDDKPVPPPPVLSAGDVRLWRIIERGLAKDPSARHQTMTELSVALADWAIERGIRVDAAGTAIDEHKRAASPSPSDPPTEPSGVGRRNRI